MPRTYSRAEWGARSAAAADPLDPAEVVGIAIHWPAMREPLETFESVAAALRSWQRMHMDDRGYRDIAYQVAVDQQGNRYELRGLHGVSAANGDTIPNRRYGAVLAVLAPGERPSEAMVEALRVVVAYHRAIFPGSRQVVGHQDVRPEPTACPGPILEAMVKAHVFEPPVPEPERPSTKATRDQITQAVKKAKEDGLPRWARRGLQRVRRNLKAWEQR